MHKETVMPVLTHESCDRIEDWIDDLERLANSMEENGFGHLSAHLDSIADDLDFEKDQLVRQAGPVCA